MSAADRAADRPADRAGPWSSGDGAEAALLELATRALDGASNGEAVEAFATHGQGFSVKVYDGEVETLTSAETRGVGVRLVRDGRLGFAFTTDVTVDGLASVLAQARANSAYGTADPGNVLPEATPVEPLPGIFRRDPAEVPAERKVAMALELERATLASDPRVTGVAAANYGDGVTRVAIASTTGIRASYARSDAVVYVSALARDGAETQTGMGLSEGRSPDELDLTAAAREAATRCTRLLGARKPRTATVPVVFDPLVTAEFLGAVVGGFGADAVQKGLSLFAGQVGERVAAVGLSLVDDGRLLDGPAAAPMDDEGVPTRRTVLVSDGVLLTYLWNTETAARAGDGTRSTGNASRAGHASTPGVSPSNVYLDAATVSAAEVLRLADGGLYVQDVSGIHSGVNPVSGEFSVGATGLWITGGELGEPVREVTVSSTITDMLLAVAAVGDDRRFFPMGGSVAGCTLLIGTMTVAGL